MKKILAAILLLTGFSVWSLEKPKLDPEKIFSDGSALYISPQEPKSGEIVTIKLRVGANEADKAQIFFTDGSTPITMKKILPKTKNEFGSFDYYIAQVATGSVSISYYFGITQDNQTVYYSRKGIEKGVPRTSYVFRITPDFTVPAWMKGAVLYQIYVDRFSNGDPTNDVVDNEYLYDNWPVKQVRDWNALPDTSPYDKGGNRTREFFGGDIQGVINKLPYLKSLGIDGIYFNPLFVSPSNHKYDAQDYEHIDPHFGVIVKDTKPGEGLIDAKQDPNFAKSTFDNASLVNKNAQKYITRTTSEENLIASDKKFKELIDKAHALGIKVIMDGVFNHVGSFSKWLNREGIYDSINKGAYQDTASPYFNYFKFNGGTWPKNETYDAWYGFKTLPKLWFENSKTLVDTVMGIGSRWVGEMGVDGWRLDVAADLGYSPKFNHQFWQQFRTSVKSANPNAVILAEVYGDSSSWLLGNEWDTVMNYDAFFEPVSFYLTGLEKHSDYFRGDLINKSSTFDAMIKEKMAKMPYQSLEIAMNQLSNHDHSRFLTRTNLKLDDKRGSTGTSRDQAEAGIDVNKGVMKEASIFQMTMPGAPTLYYGDEVGMVGWTDPDNRRAFPWDPKQQDAELLSFFKDLIQLHKTYSSLKTGSFQSLLNFRDGQYAYARWNASEKIITALNNRRVESDLEIPVSLIDAQIGEEFSVIFTADKDSHASFVGKKIVQKYKVDKEGILAITIPANGSVILLGKAAREPKAVASEVPAIKTVSPKTNLLAGQNIQIEFTMPMNISKTTDYVSIEPALEGAFSWNGTVLQFTPKKDAPKGTYRIMVKSGMPSLVGNIASVKDYSWTVTIK